MFGNIKGVYLSHICHGFPAKISIAYKEEAWIMSVKW